MAESILDVLDELYPDEKPEAGQADTSSSSTSGGSGERDERLQRYLTEVVNTSNSLLALVSFDTGEQGRECGGGRIDFDHDPISGHKQSFSYYLNADGTESWECFSASNQTGREGGTLIDYLLATGRASDNREAVRWLLDATGHQKKRQEPTSDHAEQKKSDGYLLPAPVPVQALNPPKRAPHLIGGLLRRGHTALIVARSKSYKSWDGVALTADVALGTEWHGHDTGGGIRALFIDPEIDSRTLDWRFHVVAEALGADASTIDQRVLRWSLRGVVRPDGEPPEIADLVHDIRLRIEAGEYQRGEFGLIVIDSCSCFLEGDENSSHDVRRFHNRCLELAEVTGASVMCVQHEGLAQTGDRAAINRARGSSVWADAFDLVLSLARTYPPSGEVSDYLQEGEAGFILEVGGNREFGQTEPQRLIWRFPIFRPDVEGITDGWKLASGQQKGGKKTGEKQQEKSNDRAQDCVVALLAHMLSEGIGSEGLAANKAAEVCSDALGEAVKAATLKRYVEASDVLDVYQKSRQRWLVVPSSVPVWQQQGKLLE